MSSAHDSWIALCFDHVNIALNWPLGASLYNISHLGIQIITILCCLIFLPTLGSIHEITQTHEFEAVILEFRGSVSATLPNTAKFCSSPHFLADFMM